MTTKSTTATAAACTTTTAPTTAKSNNKHQRRDVGEWLRKALVEHPSDKNALVAYARRWLASGLFNAPSEWY